MGKKPVRLTFASKAWSAVRRNPIKTATAILALLATVPGGIAGAAYLMDHAEPGWYASHGWVRDLFDAKIKPVMTAQNDDRKILRDIQIDTANRAKRDEVNNLAKYSIERDKVKDNFTLDLIDKSIQASKDSLKALDDQLNTLKDLKAKGQ